MVQSHPSSPKKILLIEDHADTAKMMRVILERHGHQVRTAATAAQAREATAREKFEVCLCDLRLPDGDGAILSRELMAEHGLKSICLSGEVTTSDLDPEPDCAFVAYLTKPIDIAKMLEAIDKVASAKL